LDQDPLHEGVQILSGDLLYPDNPTQVGMNQADNENGTIRYAVTLVEPRLPANGTGVVCRIVFHTKVPGLSALDVVSATLINKDLNVIPVTLYDGSVHVGTLIHLPLILKGQPH
jgi:hypothetical protein